MTSPYASAAPVGPVHPVGHPTGRTAARPARTGARATFALLALAGLPGAVGLGLMVGGPLLALVAVVAHLALLAYVLASMAGPLRPQETFAGATVGALSGLGIFVLAVVVGIGVEVLPFLSDGEYPHQDVWMTGSVLAGVAGGVLVLGLATLGRPRSA